MGLFDTLKQMAGMGTGGSVSSGDVYVGDDAFSHLQDALGSMENMTEMMGSMNDAMDDEDWAGAEDVRKEWIETIDQEVIFIKSMEDFEGDTSIVKGALAYYADFKKLMQNGYKTLIEMRAAGKRGTPEEQAQLEANNAEIQRITDTFNEVSEQFQEKYDL